MNFNLIAGYENEKSELLELRNMLHNFADLQKMGIRIPRGLALCGEPGVGKSLMARSIADKGLNMVELRSADCCGKEKEVINSIRDTFNKARDLQPCVLLLDEIDKIAGTSEQFYMEDNNKVKNVLLQEIDSIDCNSAILVVATCNNSESLGKALLRPGRFDRIINIDLPNLKDREEILKMYLDRLTLKKDFKANELAKYTNTFSCAMLECLVNESAIATIKKNSDVITMDIVRSSMRKMLLKGCQKDIIKDEKSRKVVAIHEAGHALVSMILTPNKLVGASIIPQGDSLGVVENGGAEESDFITTVEELENSIAVDLAGFVAEKHFLPSQTIGCCSDLQCAGEKVMQLINIFGAYDYDLLCSKYHRGSPMTPKEMKVFGETLNRLDNVALNVINDNIKLYDKIVDALLEKNILSRDELFELMGEINEKAA